MIKKVFPILLFVLFFSDGVLLAKKKVPGWISQSSWEDATYHYFVGVSTQSKTEEAARREAWDNAMAEAVQSLFGISGKVSLSSFADLKKIQIAQDIFVSSDEVRLKADSHDTYVERLTQDKETHYNVYRAIKVKRSDAKQELERLKKLALEKDQGEKKILETSPEEIRLSVEGRGVIVNEDEPAAKMAAVRNALQKACEELVQSWFKAETIQGNYATFNRVVYQSCPSFSREYSVSSSHSEENLYIVRLEVALDQASIRKKLMDAGLFREKF